MKNTKTNVFDVAYPAFDRLKIALQFLFLFFSFFSWLKNGLTVVN